MCHAVSYQVLPKGNHSTPFKTSQLYKRRRSVQPALHRYQLTLFAVFREFVKLFGIVLLYSLGLSENTTTRVTLLLLAECYQYLNDSFILSASFL